MVMVMLKMSICRYSLKWILDSLKFGDMNIKLKCSIKGMEHQLYGNFQVNSKEENVGVTIDFLE